MVGRGRGGERRRRGGRPSSSKVGGARGDIRASFLAPTNDSHLDDARQNHGYTKTSLSLSEEARNTERPHLWNSDLKLRHSRIAFVSACTSSADELNPVFEKTETNKEVTDSSLDERSAAPVKASDNLSKPYTMTPNTQMSNMTLNELQCVSARRVTLEGGLDSMSKQSNKDPGLECSEASNEAPLAHHEYADEPSNIGLMTPIMRRSPSSTGSDCSGEVILFAGRRKLCNRGDQTHTSDVQSKNRNRTYVSKPSGSPGSMATIVDRPTNATAQMIQNSSEHRPSSFSSPDYECPPDYLNSHSRFTAAKSRRRRHNRQLGKEMKDEEILDDYVANLHESGALKTVFESSMLNQRDIGGSDTSEGQDEVASLATGHVERESVTDSKEWDSAEECFNELSRWNEGLESIELVLSKRQRPSGVQYLVVGVGCSVDDARWFPASALNIQSADSLIQDFENNAEPKHHLEGSRVSDASLTGSEQVTQDLQDRLNVDDGEDERDLEERRKARMTDEQVARLLSKRDELGLGLDDLILYDGGEVWTDSRDEHQLDGLWERAVTRATPRSERMKQSRSTILSATALADILDNDPYNGFDVMDQERPSLHKRPKGRRGKLSLELSDSELEHSLHTAWEKDRTKKKMRKQEREELRAQGLLGKKFQADLKAKYAEGISMTHVKKEIKNFLLSSTESLSLPPMAQGERKIVHEIANVFKLKSKSIGGGRSRYPVLYKTSRTIQYSEETFIEAAESMLFSSRFLPRMDRVRKGALAGMGRRGGAASTGVSYRDGEVVGAAAPEIGLENRGRTMLERMGWSTGTALGASNNSRGLVQPVAQVVKTSRSGLG